MREKNGMASAKRDRLRLGSATHEPFQLRVDHAILSCDHRIAGLTRPSRDGGLGVEDAGEDRYLRNRHELRGGSWDVGGEVRGERLGLHLYETSSGRDDAIARRRHLALQPA